MKLETIQALSGPRDIAGDDLDDRPREECGVVGINGVDQAAEQAFLSLYSLQHRGQEAAGIVAVVIFIIVIKRRARKRATRDAEKIEAEIRLSSRNSSASNVITPDVSQD